MATSQFTQTITCDDQVDFDDKDVKVDEWLQDRPEVTKSVDGLVITLTFPEQQV